MKDPGRPIRTCTNARIDFPVVFPAHDVILFVLPFRENRDTRDRLNQTNCDICRW